jgi:hypothetical protein
MNVELELSVKIRMDENARPQSSPTEARRPMSELGGILNKIASHPCVLLLVRQFMKDS